MKNWITKNFWKLIYSIIALLFLTAITLFVLRLSGTINISYWGCLKPITIPSLLIGITAFMIILWRTIIECGIALGSLWDKVFKN